MCLKVKFYDVEHGSCTHVITPNNKHILVDVGSKTDKSIIQHIKNNFFADGGTLDALIITHPHEDHIWDIPNIYNLNFKPRFLLRPQEAFDIVPQQGTEVHKNIARYANYMNREYCFPVSLSESVLERCNNGDVNINVINSPQEYTTKEDLNTFSNIVVVEYCGFKFVLCGDNPAAIMKEMIAYDYKGIRNKISNATVLLTPHHGRTGEFCESFFKQVNPLLSVISDKSIVHSTQEQSSTIYHSRGIKWCNQERYVFSTRNDGNITFTINNKALYINTSKDEY